MLDKLSPIVHQYNWDLYRVPLRKVGNKYTMYVADGFTREFDEHTLPDEVKTKMAMILARANPIQPDYELSELSLMTGYSDKELSEIGWRSSDSWFVVVLSSQLLMKLKGEA